MSAGAKRLTVFLADLGHTYYGISPSTVPIGISYIKAMLVKRFGDKVDVRTFRYPEKFLAAIRSERPDIVGFGLYAWNENISVWCARAVRRAHKGAITVAGGLNVPSEPDAVRDGFIAKYSGLFDVYIPYEGELPMVKLVEKVLEEDAGRKVLSEPCPGVMIYNTGGLSVGPDLPLIKDVNEIPSPYLSGAMDEFLDDPMLMPVIQTMRGCPYRCSYCVSGDMAYTKIRPFDLERAKKEILYIKERARNRNLRVTDDNLGVLERDVELAEFISGLSRDFGYPEALKVYTDKSTGDRVKKVMLALKGHIPFNISLQSTTPEVLKKINRKNCPLNDMAQAFRWGKKNGMITGTEILHGFPGETYESFKDCVNDVYEIRVDSVGCHEVWLLPNTELSSKKSRSENGIVSHFTLGADALTIIDGELICEYEEHILSSNYMSAEEHYRLYSIDLYVTITLFYGYLRELTYNAFTYGIKPTRIFDEIIGGPSRYPILNGLFSEYAERVREIYFGSEREIYDHVKSIIDSGKRYMPTRFRHVLIGDFVFGERFGSGIDEYISAMASLLDVKDEANAGEFLETCRDLKELSLGMVINPEKPEPEGIAMRSCFDIPKWVSGSYTDRLSAHRTAPIEIALTVPNMAHFSELYEKGISLKSSSERKQLFFRHNNSSNLRRRISYACRQTMRSRAEPC